MAPRTSSGRSPIPRMIPDFTTSPARLARANTVSERGVIGRRPRGTLESCHRLEVVVEHVGTRGEDRGERVGVAFAVGDEHLDARARRLRAHRGDGGREHGGATVVEIVTRDAS